MKPFRVDTSVRQRIIDDARRLFFAHGFRHVTMDDLAKELGMSKKTLYAHFSSKRTLLETILLDKFDKVAADLDRISSHCSPDCLGALHHLIACLQSHTGEIQPSFVRDMRREAPELFHLIESRRRDLIQRHFGKLFLEGRRVGMIRTDIPAKLGIEILLGAVQAIMTPPKLEALALRPKTAYSTIIRVILEGLMTEKARPNR